MCILGSRKAAPGLALLCALSWLVPSTPAQAQSDKVVQDFALGLAAGATTGIGLSARLALKKGWTLGLTGMPVFWDGARGASVGLQGMWTFWSYGKLRSYGLLGSHLMTHRTRYSEPHLGETVRKRYHALHVGPGLGIESRVGAVGFIFEVPLTAVVALTPDTHLRFPGRVNFGVFPNVAFCVYFGGSKSAGR